MIKIVLFASLREVLNCEGTELKAEETHTVADVISVLSKRGQDWHDALTAENVLVAVNQEMANPTDPVSAGDEVAFFPPVTGG